MTTMTQATITCPTCARHWMARDHSAPSLTPPPPRIPASVMPYRDPHGKLYWIVRAAGKCEDCGAIDRSERVIPMPDDPVWPDAA